MSRSEAVRRTIVPLILTVLSIATWLAVLISMAWAQSVNNLSAITKEQFVSVFATVNAARDAVDITALAPNAPTTSLAIRGDGALLKTCALTALEKSCRFTWTKAAMLQRKCVQCAISATATEPTKTYRANTEIVRP